MRNLLLTYRHWWYRRGHRPKPGTTLYSPSLDLAYRFRDAGPVTFPVRFPETMDEDEWVAARARWLAINAAAKAAGCKCGAPNTHVRRYGGTLGGVPSEVWTCEKHQNVGSWTKVGDGPWIPGDPITPDQEEWRV
jgi:hypothetical protein